MRKLTFIASAAILLLPLCLQADENEEEAAPPLSDVWFVIPKSGMEADFRAAAAAEMVKRAEAGESRSWNAYSVAVGHNVTPVQYRSCCFEWADMDGYIAEDIEKALGASWNENVGPYVDHYHHYIEEFDYENSHWPEGGGNGPYYGVTTWDMKLGRGPGSEAARKQLSSLAIDKGWASDKNNWLWHTRVGGSPKQMIVSSYASFADMAPPEQSFFEFIAEQLGSEEEAGKVFTQFSSGFTASDYTVWALEPELSSPSEEE